MTKSIALFAMFLSVSAQAAGPDATIIKVHHDFEKAMMKNDMATAKKIVRANFDKNFVSKNPDGNQDLEQFIKDLVPPGKLTDFHFTLGKVATKGDTATLPVTVWVKGTMPAPKGKTKAINMKELDTETWKRINGAWKMTMMQQVSMTPVK